MIYTQVGKIGVNGVTVTTVINSSWGQCFVSTFTGEPFNYLMNVEGEIALYSLIAYAGENAYYRDVTMTLATNDIIKFSDNTNNIVVVTKTPVISLT